MSPLQEEVLKYLNKNREKISSYRLAKNLRVDHMKADGAVRSATLRDVILKEDTLKGSVYSLNVNDEGELIFPPDYQAVLDVLNKASGPLSGADISEKSSVDKRRVGVILSVLCVLGYADYKRVVVSVKKECVYFA